MELVEFLLLILLFLVFLIIKKRKWYYMTFLVLEIAILVFAFQVSFSAKTSNDINRLFVSDSYTYIESIENGNEYYVVDESSTLYFEIHVFKKIGPLYFKSNTQFDFDYFYNADNEKLYIFSMPVDGGTYLMVYYPDHYDLDRMFIDDIEYTKTNQDYFVFMTTQDLTVNTIISIDGIEFEFRG